jgi:DNA-binding transcriptional LysR family regulator
VRSRRSSASSYASPATIASCSRSSSRASSTLRSPSCPLPDGPLEATPLIDDPYLLLVPSEHPYAELDRAVTLEEVAAVPLMTFRGGSGQARLDDVFALYALTPRIVQRVDDSVTLHGFVSAGLGCGLLPRLAVDVEGKPVVAVPIEPRLPPRSVAIAWHRDRLHTCIAGMFVDFAVEVTARLAGDASSRKLPSSRTGFTRPVLRR